VSTTTSQHLIATSTLHGNIIVWDVETHLKVCKEVFDSAGWSVLIQKQKKGTLWSCLRLMCILLSLLLTFT